MAARTQRGEQERRQEDALLEGIPADRGDLTDETGRITRDRGVAPVVDETAEERDDLDVDEEEDEDEDEVEDDEDEDEDED